jgi:glycerol uptake facilitator protein
MMVYMAEFVGTAMLVFLGTSVGAAVTLEKANAKGTGWVFITMGWGLAVFIPAAIFGGVSGAHLNPALTIGFACAGYVAPGFSSPWASVPGYIVFQMLGGLVGAILTWILYKTHFDANKKANPGMSTVGVFSTGPAIPNVAFNLISEIFATMMLVIMFFCSGNGGTGGMGGAWWAWAVIAGIGMSFGSTTGYAMNPARDLSPRIIHQIFVHDGSSNWGYAWIPVVGSIVGGIIGGLLGAAIKSGILTKVAG